MISNAGFGRSKIVSTSCSAYHSTTPRVSRRSFRRHPSRLPTLGNRGAGQKVRERLVLSSSARLARRTGRAARAGRAARVLAEDRPRDEPRDRERGGDEALAEHPEHRVEVPTTPCNATNASSPPTDIAPSRARRGSRHAWKDPEVPSARDDGNARASAVCLPADESSEDAVKRRCGDSPDTRLSAGGETSEASLGPPPRSFPRARPRDTPRRSLYRRPRLASRRRSP